MRGYLCIKIFCLVLICLFSGFALAGAQTDMDASAQINPKPGHAIQGPITCEVIPDVVSINLFYHGAMLIITGKSDPKDEIVIKISSPPVESGLKYYGKAAGLFWMKVGDMEFKPVSNVYLVYTTGRLEKITSPDERMKRRLGYDALKSQVEITSSKGPVDKDRWFKEFIKFKEKDRLYGINEGSIVRDGSGGYILKVNWPYQAPPDKYTIEALAVKDGVAYAKATQELIVKKTGMVNLLSDLAFQNAAIYGLIAIVIAMAAGLVVGLIFKGGGGH
ncbi:MAG: TIGR02186 family protein [Dissulfurimicrobium sp.]|uniref:TIGR02186 family protein n=1 Tax=Dissulfurimicrobium TaxID=1769732 RepID=UPI003C74497D